MRSVIGRKKKNHAAKMSSKIVSYQIKSGESRRYEFYKSVAKAIGCVDAVINLLPVGNSHEFVEYGGTPAMKNVCFRQVAIEHQ